MKEAGEKRSQGMEGGQRGRSMVDATLPWPGNASLNPSISIGLCFKNKMSKRMCDSREQA